MPMDKQKNTWWNIVLRKMLICSCENPCCLFMDLQYDNGKENLPINEKKFNWICEIKNVFLNMEYFYPNYDF